MQELQQRHNKSNDPSRYYKWSSNYESDNQLWNIYSDWRTNNSTNDRTNNSTNDRTNNSTNDRTDNSTNDRTDTNTRATTTTSPGDEYNCPYPCRITWTDLDREQK